MIATAPDLSPVIETEIVPVLGASLTIPIETRDESTTAPEEMSVDGPETDSDTSDGGAVEPASVLWPARSRPMTPTPSTPGLEGPPSHPYLRESRLPREMPPVLIR